MSEKTTSANLVTLHDWYNSLPANAQIPTRDRILNECEVSYKTFYSWVNNERIPKKPYREIIKAIAKTDIHFTEDASMQANSIGLVK